MLKLLSVVSSLRFIHFLQIPFACETTRRTLLAAVPLLLCPVAWGQTSEWIWTSGSSTGICTTVNGTTTCEQPGTYGSLGIAAAENVPTSRMGAVGWTDSSGVLWLFGGAEPGANGASYSYFNDLWAFDPTTRQWTWMGGSSAPGAHGVYGTLGIPDLANVPGAREFAARWSDASGNVWLFGGYGSDSAGKMGPLNDLWEFDSSSHEWTWMGGSSTLAGGLQPAQPGVYGVLGTPAAGNFPGGRSSAAAWTDQSGHFWMFGGSGSDSAGNSGALNDLWELDPSSREWTWMGGSNVMACTTASGSFNVKSCGQPGVYGTQGVASAANIPQGMSSMATWVDNSGDFWLFGGEGKPVILVEGQLIIFGISELNELWEFNPVTQEWTWMGGSGRLESGNGVYGVLGVPAPGNYPGDRLGAASWSDGNSVMRLFGGSGLASASSQGGFLNDLWEFDPSLLEWTWAGGSSTTNCPIVPPPPPLNYTVATQCGQPGVYGTQGIAAAENIPGSRSFATAWTDRNGNLWLFGGEGFDASGTFGYLNDLWEYQVNAPGTPATVTVTARSVSRLYGQANPSLNSVTYSGFVDGDGPASLGGTLTCATTATQASPVGRYPITCSGLASSKYLVDFVAGTLSVAPVPLTITAKDTTKVLNAAMPILSATYAGFINGDGSAALAGTLTCTSTATTTSPVGSYPINCSGQSSSNYSVAYASGSLKIIYQPSGICDKDLSHSILQPINVDGSSVWNQGKTVPVKFRVCDANGVSIGSPGVIAGFGLSKVIAGTFTNVYESVSSNTVDSGFRWDTNGQAWIFNLSTDNLAAGNTYAYTILLNDGSSIGFQFGLKR